MGTLVRELIRRPALRFAGRRMTRMVVVLFALTVTTFAIVRLIPGDPGTRVLGLKAEPAAVRQLDAQLGLNKPFTSQFITYVGRLAHGNLGTSFFGQEPVTQVIRDRIGSTLQLVGLAMLVVLPLGIGGGVAAAALMRGRGGFVEATWSGLTGVLCVVPSMVSGTFLVYIFGVLLRWLPVAGTGPWKDAVLPAAAISLGPIAQVARLARVECSNVLEQEYLRAARAKRLRAWKLYLRHVLPNVLTASLTLAGIIFASLVSGAVVVEVVFARPGIGTGLVQAVLTQDYPVIQGITLLLGAFVVIGNACVDLVLGLLDPRSLEVGR